MSSTFFGNNNSIVAVAGGESAAGANTLAYTIVNNDEPNVSFTRSSSQFMSAPETTYNIQTNGGFTAVARVRFMNTLVDERIFDFGKMTTPVQSDLWVAVGSGSNTIAYSTNGASWTAVTGSTSIFSSTGLGVAYNGSNLWVAVGQGTNSIATSTNGLTWTPLGTGIFSNFGSDVAYNGTRWVAVGSGTSNRIAYSDDGVNWNGLGLSIFNIPTNFAEGRGVTWAGSLWVAVGSNAGSTDVNSNTIGYSLDGVNWTGLGRNIFTTAGYEVAWNGSNRLVAVGQGTNTIAYSDDGINWNGLGTGIFNFYGTGVAYNGTDRWVAVGYGSTNTIAYSADGINWTPVPNSRNIFSLRGNKVAWNGRDRWVATGEGGNTLAYSANGINWTPSGTGTFSAAGQGVAFNISTAVPVFSDLVTLTRASSGTSVQAWIQNATDFTATLNGGTIVQNEWTNWVMRYTLATNTFQLYQNGTLVASQTVASPLTDRTLGLNYLGYNIANNLYSSIDYAGLFVYDRALSDSEIALCLDYIQGRAMYTPPTPSPKFTLIARDLGLADGANVATWGGFTQSTPANQPIFWRRFNNWVGLGSSVFSSNVLDIAYARNRWVAGGTGATNTLAYSDDGVSWTPSGTSIFSTSGNAIASSLTRWIAGGTGTTNALAYSTNGSSWTPLGKTTFDICTGVAWNARLSRWVAVGNRNTVNQTSTIAYSNDDGSTWTLVSPSPFTGSSGSAGYCVATAILSGANTLWVAGGENNSGGNSLAYSTDGITWTGNGNGMFSTACYGVAWNGNLWVAVGQGTSNSIATSLDGLVWTPRGKPAGVDIGRRVTWTGTYWLVAGEPASGGNGLAISYDGENWTGFTRQGLFTTRGLGVASNFSV